jgi:hypothetical protein
VTRRIEALQWFGLFGGAIAWTVQFVMGFGVGEASCAAGSARWGINGKAWQIGLMAGAGVVALAALASALVVLRATRDTAYDGTPPGGRRRFFGHAGVLADVLFLAIIVNTGLVALHHFPCHQS